MNVANELHDEPSVRAVEVAGRFVGEHDGRIVRQRARERDALLLASRQLRWIVMRPARQTNFVEQRLRARAGIARARDLHRDSDVLKRGQRGDEMEELEDESDLFSPELRELVL